MYGGRAMLSFLPARGNVIGLVSVYICMYVVVIKKNCN